MSFESLQAAAAAISELTGRDRHRAAVVLGSGLGGYASGRAGAVEVGYDAIPGFPRPKVEGHAGSLYSIDVDGEGVLLLAGRVHLYEGWDMADVVFAVRAAALAGCSAVLLTNAAGGVRDGFAPGDLVAVTDHLNLAGHNPLVGVNDDRLGPRFPDLTRTYHPELRHLLHEAATSVGITLRDGVYAWFLGPSYETPAEIQMVRRLGGDLVGMSTVPEAIALAHMGVKVAAVSLVTNLAAGIAPHALSHAEVQRTADAAREQFTLLLDAVIPRLVAAA
jgi:purine-nucleoside phosphorylase